MKPPLAILIRPEATSTRRQPPRSARRRQSLSPQLTVLESRRLCAVGTGVSTSVAGGWTWTVGDKAPVMVGPAPLGSISKGVDGPWAPTWAGPRPGAAPIGLPGFPSAPGSDPTPVSDGPRTVILPLNPPSVTGPGTGFAVAEPDRDRVMVQVGDGGPRAIAGYEQGVRRPGGMAIGDLDGDGRPDVIVANTGANNLLVVRGPADWSTSDLDDEPRRFDVGAAPMGVAIGDLNNDGIPDVVVANRDSNDISVRLGSRGPDGWTLNEEQRYAVGIRPVWVSIQDVDNDGHADILVCNSGSDSLTELEGDGTGQFDVATAKTIPVGQRPVQFFVGRFDHRPGLEVLTVNAGSNDLSLVSNLAGELPVVETINSGGLDPTSAVAADLNLDGYTDLIVANSGTGSLAFFQGGTAGLTLTGILSSVVVSSPMAIAVSGTTSTGFDVYATSLGHNDVSSVHFDLGQVDEYAPPTPSEGNVPKNTESPANSSADQARWLTREDSDFNLVGVLGLPARRSNGDVVNPARDSSTQSGTIRSRVTPQSLDHDEVTHTEGDGDPESTPGPNPEGESETGDGPVAWARFVMGVEANLAAAEKVAGQVVANTQPPWVPGGVGLHHRDEATHHQPAPVPAVVADGESSQGAMLAPTEDGTPEVQERSASSIRADLLVTLSTGVLLAHLILIRLHPVARPGWMRHRRGRTDGAVRGSVSCRQGTNRLEWTK